MRPLVVALPAVPPSSPPAAPPYADTALPGIPRVTTVERSNLRAFRRVAGWIGLACVVMALLYAPPPWRDPQRYAVSVAIGFCYAAGLWFANAYTADLLNLRSGWSERPMRRLLITVGLSFLASLLVIVLVGELWSVLAFHNPLGHSLRHHFWNQSAFPLLLTVIISLFMHSRSFLLAWREATVRAERLEKETAVARLDSLRRQLDPHFLFNSLNALTSLVEENDPARAVRFIHQLSQVYRYVLDNQSQELVPLADELRFAESYLFLQKTRLGDALAVALDLPAPGALTPYWLPPLALQLLLENVVKHNTAFQTDPLRLHVGFDAQGPSLTVRNACRPRALAPGESSGLGLKNLAARYAFLTPRPLAVAEENGEFVVTLPLLQLGG